MMLAHHELVAEEIDVSRPAEVRRLAAYLGENGLPDGDLAGPGKRFFEFWYGPDRVGLGGIERREGDGLLRGIAVFDSARRHGHGAAIVAWLEGEAARRGVHRLYLLTIGAAPFFARLGFHRIERAEVPRAIAATAQFTELCPQDAVCMMRGLAGPARGDRRGDA